MALSDAAVLNRGHHSIKLGGSYVWNPYREDGGNLAGANFAFPAAPQQREAALTATHSPISSWAKLLRMGQSLQCSSPHSQF